MKKYIKPTIKVRELAAENSILAASGFAKNSDGLWEEDVTTTPKEITKDGDILSKKNLFESWDEE